MVVKGGSWKYKQSEIHGCLNESHLGTSIISHTDVIDDSLEILSAKWNLFGINKTKKLPSLHMMVFEIFGLHLGGVLVFGTKLYYRFSLQGIRIDRQG